jgi:hypothetical protein
VVRVSGFPAGLPIRIAVRIDFADGSQHEHEVRTSDAVPAVEGFFPEGVVTADVAARMRHDLEQERQRKAMSSDPAGGVIQVVFTPALQPALGKWLVTRGLYLYPIPADDDDLPTYGVGISSERAP